MFQLEEKELKWCGHVKVTNRTGFWELHFEGRLKHDLEQGASSGY